MVVRTNLGECEGVKSVGQWSETNVREAGK